MRTTESSGLIRITRGLECRFQTNNELLFRFALKFWTALMKISRRFAFLLSIAIFFQCSLCKNASAEWIWIEGETPLSESINPHPWYNDVDRSLLSGGKMLSHFDDNVEGQATYSVNVDAEGSYELWLRCNPILSHLKLKINDAPEFDVELQNNKQGEVNVAADKKPDLRFLAWVHVGKLPLHAGKNTIRFRMTSEKHHHGYLDCFVFTNESFSPRGILKPDEIETKGELDSQWYSFKPNPIADQECQFSLRHLNETVAGENGPVTVVDGKFRLGGTNEPVRFWGVNGPPHELTGESLKSCAELLSRYGVNLVRIHGAVFDEQGMVDDAKVAHIHEVVAAMKAEGIYTHLSIYFPLWFKPAPNHPWLVGYDGATPPFAALFFNKSFQDQYRNWVKLILTSPSETGVRLIDEPAVFGIEIQNEDSLFFWTFDEKNIPEPQLRIMQSSFGDYLKSKHGSIENAFKAWNARPNPNDAVEEGRISFRPIWNLFNERTPRDLATAQYLFSVQAAFYSDTKKFIEELGFQGLIHASNWTTASPERLGTLEKLSYFSGDFIDRHGYFDSSLRGDFSAWSIREGHTFMDRSALRFDPAEPSKPKVFNHPVMDVRYNNKPSMISETTFNRPNRFRSEAPIYFAAYGALQDSDAIIHFAFDGANWETKPQYWVQPWTLASPAMLGQFPAAALIYRQGLVETGYEVVSVRLSTTDLGELKPTPVPQDASFDELRQADVPKQQVGLKDEQRIDPLVHYVGKTSVTISSDASQIESNIPSNSIDRKRQIVMSSTGQLRLDYGRGILRIDAKRTQGISGSLKEVGQFSLKNLDAQTDMELAHIILTSLDEKPIASSSRLLLQVMTEERPSGFETEPVGESGRRIVALGNDPWLVKRISGTLSIKRSDAATLRVKPLAQNGAIDESQSEMAATKFDLLPETNYYLIE